MQSWPGVGAKSRLFGDTYAGAKRPGWLNPPGKDSSFAIGWSARGIKKQYGISRELTLTVATPSRRYEETSRTSLADPLDNWEAAAIHRSRNES